MNRWDTTEYPTMEITTSVPKQGCVVNCVFCPQEVLKKSYDASRFLTLDNFKQAIETIPANVRIIFSGFVEPWMNKSTTDMLIYAHEKGHPICVFTTGIGMSLEDVDRIKNIPFESGPNGGFTLHLPDQENKAKHPITDKYIQVLQKIKESNLQSFMVMSMGDIHPSVRHIFETSIRYDMWSRAGNLLKEALLKPDLLNYMNEVNTIYKAGDMTCNCVEGVYHNVLMPNGDVVLCCQDYNMDEKLGNLFTSTYENIMPQPNQTFSLCNYCENGCPIT